MTRIIAGDAGGVRLQVPATGTRPTSDRVRESLFGSLESLGALRGARVLDLYAGSGALGLEAASRGAAAVDLVEHSKPAAAIVRRNAQAVTRSIGAPAPEMRVHANSVRGFLRSATATFDLVFLDPPYDLGHDQLTADLAAVTEFLSPEALVIVERASRSGAPDWNATGLTAVRDRGYGDTALWWAQPVAASQSR